MPPVGWQSTVEQPLQMTTDCAWLKTVVLRIGEKKRGEREKQGSALCGGEELSLIHISEPTRPY